MEDLDELLGIRPLEEIWDDISERRNAFKAFGFETLSSYKTDKVNQGLGQHTNWQENADFGSQWAEGHAAANEEQGAPAVDEYHLTCFGQQAKSGIFGAGSRRDVLKDLFDKLDQDVIMANIEDLAAAGGGSGAGGIVGRAGVSRGQGTQLGGQNEEELTLRLTNLRDDVTEEALYGLIKEFKDPKLTVPTKVYIPKEEESKRSRCFAFVAFNTRREAEHAFARLHKIKFCNALLNVEWAKAHQRRPQRQ